ncbi:hypothetical protein [Pseudomonas sp. TWP3-2]|uniref:hypothetical protein n=1 Tax=Pseudomonas sp. TWP3-2 TaxID=2804574 RepID=UPI003CF4875F
MKFNDILVNTIERFTLGIEETTGTSYVCIPVSNRMADYEEYYAISEEEFELFLKDSGAALQFVTRCRNRLVDEHLMFKPGTDRGVAT